MKQVNKKQIMMRGVIPSKQPIGCAVFKSAKKGQKSFRITSSLLNTMVKKANKVGKAPLLIIHIPANEKESYLLTCHVLKEKN